MKRAIPITTLFPDIGSVLLTDGWGHESGKLAVKKFDLNPEEMENRHHLTGLHRHYDSPGILGRGTGCPEEFPLRQTLVAPGQVAVLVIRTDGELMIAKTVYQVLGLGCKKGN